MSRSCFILLAISSLFSVGASAESLAGVGSCRGLKSYDILRAISAYTPSIPERLSEIEKLEKSSDNRISYFIEDDGSWGFQAESLTKHKLIQKLYLYCDQNRPKSRCTRTIPTKLFGMFTTVAEMKYDGKVRADSYPIQVEVLTNFAVIGATRASTWFWLKRNPETDCLVAYAKSATGQLEPFNLSFFAAEKNVGAKQASIWRVEGESLFAPYTAGVSAKRLSAQPLE